MARAGLHVIHACNSKYGYAVPYPQTTLATDQLATPARFPLSIVGKEGSGGRSYERADSSHRFHIRGCLTSYRVPRYLHCVGSLSVGALLICTKYDSVSWLKLIRRGSFGFSYNHGPSLYNMYIFKKKKKKKKTKKKKKKN